MAHRNYENVRIEYQNNNLNEALKGKYKSQNNKDSQYVYF
jgi:hypothetical protein